MHDRLPKDGVSQVRQTDHASLRSVGLTHAFRPAFASCVRGLPQAGHEIVVEHGGQAAEAVTAQRIGGIVPAHVRHSRRAYVTSSFVPDTTKSPPAPQVNPDFEPGDDDGRDLSFHPADPARARTLSAGQIEGFNHDGFVSPLPAFSREEIDRLRAYLDGLIKAVIDAPDPRNSYSINTYHMVCEGLYDLIHTPMLLDYVEDIVGPDIVLWGSHLFAKLPGDGKAVPLHQDATYWPLSPTKSVTVWLAVDDADEENAAMEFVPGSHRLGPLPHEVKALDGTRVLRRQALEPDQYGDRFVNTLRAGQVSLHSDLLLHGSAPNRSHRRRAGLTLRYAAAEVRPVPGWEWWTMPSVHCRGSVPEHWSHWRRPEGEHPEKMAAVWGEFDGNPIPDAG